MPHVRAKDRRQQFVDAAIRVIAREGVGSATTRRIAEEAGAPTASLHYCFSSKDELFQAVFEQGPNEGVRAASRYLSPGMGLAAGVEAILRGYMAWVLADKTLQQAQFELVFWALRNPEARHLPRRTYRSYIDATAQLLRESMGPEDPAIDVEVMARQVVAVVDGHMLQAISMEDDSTMQLLITQATEMIWAWLAASTRATVVST